MRLHHQPRSRSTRVLWLLEELGTPFDLTVMRREAKQTAEYRTLHPLGRSPALETDDGPVFESAALSSTSRTSTSRQGSSARSARTSVPSTTSGASSA